MNKEFVFSYEFVPGQVPTVNLINRSSGTLWITHDGTEIPCRVQPEEKLKNIYTAGWDIAGDYLVLIYFYILLGIDCDPNPVLQHQLFTFLNEKKFTDFKIKCAAEEFPCHKSILAARSPVLAHAFEFCNEVDQHEIEGFEPATVKKLLEYLYSGRVADDNLLRLADYLGIDIKKSKVAEMVLRPRNMHEPEGTQVLKDKSLNLMSLVQENGYHLEPSYSGIETRMSWTIPEFETWRESRLISHVEISPEKRITFEDKEFIFNFEIHLDQISQPLSKSNRPRRLFRLVNRSSSKVVINGDNFCPEVFLPNGGYLIAEKWYKMKDQDLEVSYNFTILLDLDQDRQLQHDLLNLFNEKKITDFKLKCAEVEFPCHKAILAARSPTLAGVFESDTGEHEISDFQPNTVKQALEFIYSDNLTGEADLDLLKLAYSLDIKGLVRFCERSLARTVTSANVYDLLDLAYSWSGDSLCYLKNSVLAFCNVNYKELRGTHQWSQRVSNNSRLLQDIADFMKFKTMR